MYTSKERCPGSHHDIVPCIHVDEEGDGGIYKSGGRGEGQGFDDRVRWHREFSIGDDDGGRVLWYEGEEPITPREGEVVECRWVSDWETLDDVKGDDLRTRLVHAAVESLVEGDPVLVIGVGENELKIGWEPQ